MKTAVIYARYSSDKQTEQSIEGQLRECNEYAERNGIHIVGNYIDRAMSGKNDDRYDFQRMMKDSDKRAWDYVLVYKLDRMSRNKYEMAIHRKHLKDNGIKIISVKENIPDSPEGILLESLLEGMNQYYSEELAQKTRRGQRESRIKGLYSGGRLNYGYYAKDKKIYINEDEAKIVQEIFSRYTAGEKGADIEKDFAERDVLYRGKPFTKAIIYFILHGEKYTGLYKHDNAVYDNIYPPIISTELYEIARKKIDGNRYGKHVPDVSYLLRGKAFCGYCGTRMTSYTGKSKSGRIFRYYKCYNAVQKIKCPACFIKKDVLDELVVNALIKVLTEKEKLEFITNKIFEIHNKNMLTDSPIKILERELAKVSKSITNLLTAIENGIYTDTTKERLQELEKQKQNLQDKLIAERMTERTELSKSDITRYLLKTLDQSPSLLIEHLVNKVFVYNNKIEIILKYSTLPDTPNTDKDNPDEDTTYRGIFIMQETLQYIVYSTQGLSREAEPKAKATKSMPILFCV